MPTFTNINKSTPINDDLRNEFMRIFGKDINHIELFDNSHTGGKNTVGAMVVYKNYKPSKKDYRLFKLDDGADDLASMREMLYRRYFRVLKDNLEKPDLLIVDGGKTQIQIAKEIIKLLLDGYTENYICTKLNVSPDTVSNIKFKKSSYEILLSFC